MLRFVGFSNSLKLIFVLLFSSQTGRAQYVEGMPVNTSKTALMNNPLTLCNHPLLLSVLLVCSHSNASGFVYLMALSSKQSKKPFSYVHFQWCDMFFISAQVGM